MKTSTSALGCLVALAVALVSGPAPARAQELEADRFDEGAEGWQIYDYNGGIAGGGNVFYPVTWEAAGGVGDTGYVWGDDSRWRIDTPEDPNSILPFILYRSWVGQGAIDLRGAEVSVYLRGDDLDLEGGQCFFWVLNQARGSRWHLTARPLEISDGDWGEKVVFRLENDESLWHRSWSRYPDDPASLDEVLAGGDSFGFSFVGFSGEVTGRFAMDELVIQRRSCGDGLQHPGEECDDGNPVDGDGCDSNCTLTACGNGIVTSGEECDDGEATAGCCDPACRREPDASPCNDANVCTRDDSCTGGVCLGNEAPEPFCRSATHSTLALRSLIPDRRDLLLWKWKGGETMPGALGDPVSGNTSFTLCLYDTLGGVPSLATDPLEVPAGGTCASRPCWRTIRGGGLRYKDRDRLRHGILGLVAKPGAEGRASLVVRAGLDGFDPPGLPLDQDPLVTLQLRSSDGECWGVEYDAAPARTNDGRKFRAAAP